jgi:hypothetical protein
MSHLREDVMRLDIKEYVAIGLIAVMMLSPLAAAMFAADEPELQHKARTDLIQPDPTKPPTGAPPPPPAPQQ